MSTTVDMPEAVQAPGGIPAVVVALGPCPQSWWHWGGYYGGAVAGLHANDSGGATGHTYGDVGADRGFWPPAPPGP